MRALYQKTIILENTCNAVYEDELLKKAMLWFADDPINQPKKVFMYGRYPAISIGKHKLHIHRLIMAYLNNGLQRNIYVNHVDGNKLNASKENLKLMTSFDHQSKTNKGRKQAPEHVAKRIDATTQTRYGHSIYENPELLNQKQHGKT